MPSPSFVPVIPTGRDITFDGDVTFTGTVTFDGAVATNDPIAVTAAATTTDAITVKVTGDTQQRIICNGNGTLEWGSGALAVDTNLYRSAANTLKTDDALVVAGTTTLQSTLAVTGASTLGGAATVTGALSTSNTWGSLVTGDTFDRHRVLASGAHEWGSGTGARDTTLSRGAANRLDVSTADLRIATAGRGLQITEGSNARMGTATLVGGTLTVANTSVTANTRIFLTTQSLGTVATPQAIAVTARVANTSFTITSADGTDTSVIAWQLIEAA